MGEKEITIEIKRPEIVFLLIFLSVILVLELQLTFNSPIAFGDEGFHTRLAQWIAEEKEYPIWIPFSKTKLIKYANARPLLWNLLEACMYFVLGFHESIVKFLTPFIGVILTGIVGFILGTKIYNKEVGFIAAIITTTVSSLVTYSVLFYTDILFVFYLSLFVLTLMLAFLNKKEKYWILSGIFAGLAFLTKIVSVVIFPFLFLLIIYEIYKKYELKLMIRNYVIFFIFFFIVTGSFFLRNIVYYNTPYCETVIPLFKSTGCVQNYDYNSTKHFEGSIEQVGTGQNFLSMGIVNYFNFAYGNIWFVPLAFICGLILIGIRKNTNDILIILLIIAFLFIFYFSWSGRAEDTARWALGLVPVIALIAGIYFEIIYNFVKKYHRQLSLVVFLIIIVYSLFGSRILDVTGNGEFRGYGIIDKLFGYDIVQNGQVTHASGLRDIKQFSSAFFEACDFIKKNTTDDVLIMTVWDSQTAYNCQRNVICLSCLPESADIVLGNNLNFTIAKLKKHEITHIFIQKFSLGTNNLGTFYPINFVQFLDDNLNNFIKIFENGPSIQQCIQMMQTGKQCDGSLIYEIRY